MHCAGLALGLILLLAAMVGLEVRAKVVEQKKATEAEGLVRTALAAETPQMPAIIDAMAPYRRWVDPLLLKENERAPIYSRRNFTPVWPFCR